MSDISQLNKKEIQRVVLGEEWCDSALEDGVNHSITVSNNGYIPGTNKRWETEIDKRKRLIEEEGKKGTFAKLISFFTVFFKSLPPSVSGEDIALIYPVAHVKKLVRKLKRDPSNFALRLELVDLILKKDQDFPIEIYRDAFLQASVALSFEKISVEGVQLALKAQQAYLERLQGACRHESRLIFNQLKLSAADEEEIQLKELRRQYIHLNIEALDKLIAGTTTNLETQDSFFKDVFKLPSLKQIRLKKDEAYQNIFKYIPPLVQFLRHHTLLLPKAHTMPDLLIKAEKNNAVGHFLKGMIYFKELDLQLCQFRKGQNSSARKQKIQELFKQAYHSLGQAVKQAGGDYQKNDEMGNDLQILIEYIVLIRYFIKTVSKAIQLPVPKPWAKDNLTRAILLLDQTELEDKMILDLRFALEEDLKSINGK